MPADPQQIDRTKRIVETVWKAIEAGIFYPSPSAMNCPSPHTARSAAGGKADGRQELMCQMPPARKGGLVGHFS